MTYKLEKKIWSDKDFDKMGWHDNHVYKIRLTKDLEMDGISRILRDYRLRFGLLLQR